jgi:hypothetical protein
MPDLTIESPNSISYIASWLEFYITVKKEDISKAELQRLIQDASGSEPRNEFLDDVWRELEFRQHWYGDEPPFLVQNREINYNIVWETFPEYLVCLILNLDGAAEQSSRTGKLFERLSCEAIKNYIGGDAIIYGFPHKQTVNEIANIIDEKYNFSPTTNFKDRGVDIIAWRSFGDGRKSKIVGLFQCAAGFHWKKKLLEVPLNAWRAYISWGDSIPMKGFTTPVVIGDDIFFECILTGGLMFDRPRLYRNIRSITAIDQSLRDELLLWCQNKVKHLMI